MKSLPNPGKKLSIIVDSKEYLRIPVKTHLVSSKDDVYKTIEKYAKPILEKGDALFISERMIAIMQGRSYRLSEIHPTKLAYFFSKFVSKHPGGIGLKSPWTMQLALDEAGLPRIMCAAFISAITRPFGIKGLFYHVVGNDINAIDGPCEYTLPPGNDSAKLGPKNPQKVANELKKILGTGIVIIDANDYGVRVMANSSDMNTKLIKYVFKDNPLGQTDEQTPMAVVRKV